MSPPYKERQTAKVVLRVINIDDNPPVITGLKNGILTASVYLSSSPNTDSIFTIESNDPDFVQETFFYNISNEQIVLKENEVSRQRSSQFIAIGSRGEVSLLSSISANVFYINIELRLGNCFSYIVYKPSAYIQRK